MEANKKKIYGMRLFYVVKPNAETVVKFGIAGTRSGKSEAWARLSQYGHYYGESSDLNPCVGVQLLFLAGNKYNSRVPLVKSDVYKKELACKQYFRSAEVNAHLIGRGFERLNLDPSQPLSCDSPSTVDAGIALSSRSRSGGNKSSSSIIAVNSNG